MFWSVGPGLIIKVILVISILSALLFLPWNCKSIKQKVEKPQRVSRLNNQDMILNYAFAKGWIN